MTGPSTPLGTGKPGILRDLFMGPNNTYWDLGRILSFAAGAAMIAGQAWNIRLGIPIDLAALGTGFGAILVGAAGLIFVKDRALPSASLGTGGKAPGDAP